MPRFMPQIQNVAKLSALINPKICNLDRIYGSIVKRYIRNYGCTFAILLKKHDDMFITADPNTIDMAEVLSDFDYILGTIVPEPSTKQVQIIHNMNTALTLKIMEFLAQDEGYLQGDMKFETYIRNYTKNHYLCVKLPHHNRTIALAIGIFMRSIEYNHHLFFISDAAGKYPVIYIPLTIPLDQRDNVIDDLISICHRFVDSELTPPSEPPETLILPRPWPGI
jgi:hypothetical protein